ncbi:MAG TPA: VCBS repeat-containing protein, partial [Armatimonadota bacterium]|nr:VCBS repeat-containing protein [Armatimonadota bacterium]
DNRMKRRPYKVFILSIGWLGHWYETSVPPREPAGMIGLNRILLSEPLREDLVLGRGRLYAGTPVVNDVPAAECFNKITFREGLGEDDQYLMLDGLGGVTYSGNDANAIIEYSRFGTPLIVQYTIKHEPFYQNMVSVSRGNAGDATGTFSRLLQMADLGELLYTASELDPVCGAANVRHLFMERGGWCAAIDDVALHNADEQFLACTFRGFGQPELDPDARTWTLRNDGADLRLQSVALPGVEPIPELAASDRVVYVSAEGAEVVVRVLRETVAGRFAAGDRYRYASVLEGVRAGEQPTVSAVGLSADAIAVRGPQTVVLGTPRDGTTTIGDLTIEAAAFRLSRDSAQFVAVTSLSASGEALVQLRQPVTVRFDFSNRTCTWQSPESVCVQTIEWAPAWRVEGSFAELLRGIRLPTGESVTCATTALRHAIADLLESAEQAQPPQPPAPIAPELPMTVSEAASLLPAGAPINATAFSDLTGDGRDEVICAREDGHLVAAGLGGGAIFDIATGDSPLLCVWVGELSGRPAGICGARNGMVRCYDAQGVAVWEHRNTHWGYGAKPAVYSLAVGDFTGDGTDRLALGCHGGVSLLELGPEPRFVCFTEVYAHKVAPMQAINIYGGAKQWLLLNTSGGAMKLVDAAEGVVADSFARFWGGRASYLGVHQFEGDDLYFVHAGANGVGCGRLLREPWLEGKRGLGEVWAEDSWYRRTDGETGACVVHDLDGDGVPEIITGNETGFLVAYDHHGERLWKRLLGTPVNDLALLDITGDARPEITAACDHPGLSVLDAERGLLAQWSPGDGAAIERLLVVGDALLAVTRTGEVIRLRL